MCLDRFRQTAYLLLCVNHAPHRKETCNVYKNATFGADGARALVLTATLAWAEGLGLGETKEQLKLKYDLSVVDHGTGRVTVSLTIADQGRLKPLDSVELAIPSKDGTGYFDLAVSLATKTVDGKLLVSVHLKRELAERAEIHLKTSSLDGKQEPLTWYYHAIPIAEYIKKGERKKD